MVIRLHEVKYEMLWNLVYKGYHLYPGTYSKAKIVGD